MQNLPILRAELVTLVVILLAPLAANAQDSVLVNYQGHLTDDAGNPLSGAYSMVFTIYEDDGSGTYADLWSETHAVVAVAGGGFNVLLGSVDNLPTALFDGEPKYLGIKVGEDPEISPRTLLTSVPAAASARRMVGDIETMPGQLILKSLSGAPAVILKSRDGVGGVFENAEEFDMAGSLEIDVNADASGLLVTQGSEDDPPDVELGASTGSNFIRLHPPDPCVPPDPCGSPVELFAHTDYSGLILNHSWEDYPTTPSIGETRITAGNQTVDFDIVVSVPDDDEVEAISLGVDMAASSSHMSVRSPDGLASFNVMTTNDDGAGGGGVAMGLLAAPGSEVMGVEPSPFHFGYALKMYEPTSASPTEPMFEVYCGSEGTGLNISDEIGQVMGLDPSPFNNGYTMKLLDPTAATETPIVEISSSYGDGTYGKVNVGWLPPPDDNHPGVELTSTPSMGKVLIGGADDGTGAAKMIVLQANSVAEVGIGTDDPSEALHVVGNVYVTGDVYTMTDTKAKSNVVPIEDALAKVDELEGVTYDLQGEIVEKMGGAVGRQVGFLAQDVEQVLPEAVKAMDDGYKAVDYSRLTALLVEAVKDLKAENESLRLRVEALEGR